MLRAAVPFLTSGCAEAIPFLNVDSTPHPVSAEGAECLHLRLAEDAADAVACEVTAPDDAGERTIWALERCRRLEHQQYALLEEVKLLQTRLAERDEALQRMHSANTDLKDATRESTAALQAARRKLRVQHEVLSQTQQENKKLENAMKRMRKERGAEKRMVDSITLQHSMLETKLKDERARHTAAEGEYDTSMEQLKGVMDDEIAGLRGEIEQWRQREAQLLQQLSEAHASIVDVKGQLAEAQQRETAAHKGRQSAATRYERLKESFAEEVGAIADLKRDAEEKLATVHKTESRLKEALALLGAQEAETVALRQAVQDGAKREASASDALRAAHARLRLVADERDELRRAAGKHRLQGVDGRMAAASMLFDTSGGAGNGDAHGAGVRECGCVDVCQHVPGARRHHGGPGPRGDWTMQEGKAPSGASGGSRSPMHRRAHTADGYDYQRSREHGASAQHATGTASALGDRGQRLPAGGGDPPQPRTAPPRQVPASGSAAQGKAAMQAAKNRGNSRLMQRVRGGVQATGGVPPPGGGARAARTTVSRPQMHAQDRVSWS